MDGIAIVILVIVVLCLGGILGIAATLLMRMRLRRQRLEMRRHVQAIEPIIWNEARRT